MSLIAPTSECALQPCCAVGSGCLISIFSFSQTQETCLLFPQHRVPPLTSLLLMSSSGPHLGMRRSLSLQSVVFFEGASTLEDCFQVLSPFLSASLPCPHSQHCCSDPAGSVQDRALLSLPLISPETCLQSQLCFSLLVCSIFTQLAFLFVSFARSHSA